MAKALGIEATDITYAKYYTEYCAIHNLGTPRHTTGEVSNDDRDQAREHDENQLKYVLSTKESPQFNCLPRNTNGRFEQNSFYGKNNNKNEYKLIDSFIAL